MATKKTLKTTSQVISNTVQKTESIPKTMNVKMKVTYIGNLILREGREYEIPYELGNTLLKNGECDKC